MTSMPSASLTKNDIDSHIAKIRESGVLARSTHLHSLFEFLYSCHQSGRVPKEFEIAIEGMGRNDGFDVTQDAMVRVYMHKLRKKLDDFYEQNSALLPFRLTIPKGEYRFVLENLKTEREEHAIQPSRKRYLLPAAIGILALSLTLNVLQFFGKINSTTEHASDALWQPLFMDERPIAIVVGDYYIFAETDGKNVVKRLVRDFELNSAMDLANYLQLYPNRAEQQFDVGLSYTPTGTAYALNNLSTAINSHGKTAKVVLSSELTQEIIRAYHVVYVGHLSGLGLLSDIVFEVSKFNVGSGFDELIDSESGERYVNSNFSQIQRSGNIAHLAYLSSFVGPNANRVIVVAGFRDEGLRELVDNINTEVGINALDINQSKTSFEAIYKSAGYGHTISPAKIAKLHKITKTLSTVE